MERVPHEVVARYDGAIRTQPIGARRPHETQVSAVGRGEALAGPVEIQPAQLEAISYLPDTVEDRPMALVEYR